VGLAGNALIGALLGDQITAAKDKISLSIAAGLSGKDAELIAASGQSVGEVHKEGFIDQAGDAYLNGAKTLLDIALGSGGAIAGKAVGRIVQVNKNSDALIFSDQKSIKDFEKNLIRLPVGERVAMIKQTAAVVAAQAGMVKDSKLSRMNGRDVYKSKSGDLFSLDSQHGRFEVINPKNGKNLGEVDFSFASTKPADSSGGHDIRIK